MLGDFDGDGAGDVTSATITAGGDITLGNGTFIDATNDITITASGGGDIDLDDADSEPMSRATSSSQVDRLTAPGRLLPMMVT